MTEDELKKLSAVQLADAWVQAQADLDVAEDVCHEASRAETKARNDRNVLAARCKKLAAEVARRTGNIRL